MQRHIMFDIDGTLVKSFDFDELCFTDSVKQVLGSDISADWESYTNITDAGLLMELLERTANPMPISELVSRVKPLFIEKVRDHANTHGVEAISGAPQFIEQLTKIDGVTVSFATGGWLETALIKLEAAGFNTQGLNIASSNDHFQRTEIMRMALGCEVPELSVTPVYFGDAEWDKRACAELGFDFILVGDRTDHVVQINDYQDTKRLEHLLGKGA